MIIKMISKFATGNLLLMVLMRPSFMMTDEQNRKSKFHNQMVIKLLSGFVKVIFSFMVLIIVSQIDTSAQVIRGSVVDSETGSEVGFASVYFSGTTVGTVAGEDGEFELDISRYISLPLTVSAVGYSSVTLEELSFDKPLKVSLAPLIYDIATVNISARSLQLERRSNLRIFREQFLGRTQYARRCNILNEEDITFNYGYDSVILRAFALKPLQVENNALGYTITYYLESFEFCRETGNALYTGYFNFSDDISGIFRNIKETRRNNAYLGSAMHFFRSLWDDDLQSQGFKVWDQQGKNLSYQDIVFVEGGQKYLEHSGDLFISYSANPDSGIFFRATSPVRLLKGRVFFDESGYFDPVAIMLTGDMGQHRVSDMLPIGFVPR